jgi:hypothetical protein
MKIYSIASLVLGFAPTAECFGVADFLVKIARDKTKIEIFEGVGLPNDTDNLPVGARASYLASLSPKANKDVLKTLLGDNRSFISERLLNTEEVKPLGLNPPKRSKNWESIQAKLTNEIIKPNMNSPDPTEGYLYFGNQNFKKILSMLCQVNPFFASALTLSENKEYFELIAYSPEPDDEKDPKYLRIVRELTDHSHYINCRFNLDMSINQIETFDKSGKSKIVPEEEWNYYSSGILYNLEYYSSCVHATVHILHYLLCGGIRESTLHNDSLRSWADPYDDNIAIKHAEVAAALVDSTILGAPFADADTKLLTGKNGFGGSNAVKPKMQELLKLWGSLKDSEDFTMEFLLKDIYQGARGDKQEIEQIDSILKNADILTEFKKHLALVKPFASDLTDAMKKTSGKDFEIAEEKLKKFMGACGGSSTDPVSKIDSISSWTQLMCCTGLYHGSTLSYTRLMAAPEVAMWKNIHTKQYDEDDIQIIVVGFQTIQGMTEGRHVFMSGGDEDFKWNTSKMDPEVKKVLEKYEAMACDLKTAYEKEIEAGDELREYGWILTDHCNDGYDGKQHTVTTYI